MTKHPMIRGFILSAAAVALLGTGCALDEDLGVEAQESHSWGNYHWSTSGNLSLDLGDNVTSAWNSYLSTSSSDWSKSSVLDTRIVNGNANPKNCRPTAGMVEVCNSSYGNNGWLGIAQIWLSGGHIAQGVVKLNDYYFNMSAYNSPAWRNLVMCQEIGHTFGLDHQDENFNNTPLGTCMDYSNDPVPNQHPDQHDYAQLGSIYSHSHLSEITVSEPPSHVSQADLHAPQNWGELAESNDDGNVQMYVRSFGGGNHVITHVLWAPY